MAGVYLHKVIKLQHTRYVLRSIFASLRMLSAMVRRLLQETGWATHFTTFMVGVSSGEKQLGEGCGLTMKNRLDISGNASLSHMSFPKEMCGGTLILIPAADAVALAALAEFVFHKAEEGHTFTTTSCLVVARNSAASLCSIILCGIIPMGRDQSLIHG